MVGKLSFDTTYLIDLQREKLAVEVFVKGVGEFPKPGGRKPSA